MKKNFLVIFLVFLFLGSYGQGVNTDYYKYGASPSDLPDFLLQSVETEPLILGISDPDMDSAKGAQQAIERARSLLYLSQNARVRSLFDYYMGEEYSGSGGTFQSFVQLAVHDSVFPEYVVLDTFYTRFQEAIVRIRPSSDDLEFGFSIGRSYDIRMEKFRMEYEWGGAAEFQDQTEMEIQYFDSISSSDLISVYKYTHQFEVYSAANGEERFFPTLRYNYVQPNTGQQQYFKYGLWVHIMDRFIQEIANESKRMRELVKKTGETYKSSTTLSQGLTSNLVTFQIRDINLVDGEVEISLDVEFLEY
ncbi:MAG TPA: hypothetical protein VJ937_12510 [Salinivirga sp.]|uniref:hypothetical protein n=1 Tax=Salinivirga sp. TaxID=1970192 RepID=UPI002B47DDF7|nr:hypothetical protein [Salinivirga sp.]HKK60296.1 hypothetical protein [Salinivirga sp.]